MLVVFEAGERKPMSGCLGGVCADALSGDAAAAPPSSVMNSRLFIDRTAFDPSSQG
jgi:hypothetical protein